MGYDNTPFECGLDQYVSLEADIESLSIDALRTRPVKTRLMGLVMEKQVKLKDLRLMNDGKVIGMITSNTWSPKHSVHLAFAKCDIGSIADVQDLHVNSSTGEVPAIITKLPFNFEFLGL